MNEILNKPRHVQYGCLFITFKKKMYSFSFNHETLWPYSPSALELSDPEPVLWYSGKSNPSVSSPIDREMSRRSSIRSPHSGLPSRESPSGDGGLRTSPAMVEIKPNLGDTTPHSPDCDKRGERIRTRTMGDNETWEPEAAIRLVGEFQNIQLWEKEKRDLFLILRTRLPSLPLSNQHLRSHFFSAR